MDDTRLQTWERGDDVDMVLFPTARLSHRITNTPLPIRVSIDEPFPITSARALKNRLHVDHESPGGGAMKATPLVTKLFDRRGLDGFREDLGLPPWSFAREAALQALCDQDGPLECRFDNVYALHNAVADRYRHTEAGHVEEAAMTQDWKTSVAHEELFLLKHCWKDFQTERDAYASLCAEQGKAIPWCYGNVVVPYKASTASSIGAIQNVFDLLDACPGLLLEYIPGDHLLDLASKDNIAGFGAAVREALLCIDRVLQCRTTVNDAHVKNIKILPSLELLRQRLIDIETINECFAPRTSATAFEENQQTQMDAASPSSNTELDNRLFAVLLDLESCETLSEDDTISTYAVTDLLECAIDIFRDRFDLDVGFDMLDHEQFADWTVKDDGRDRLMQPIYAW